MWGPEQRSLATGSWLLATALPSRERQQRDVARLLDGGGEAALVRRANAGQPPWHDLARLGHELPEQPYVLVIHAVDLLDAELANLLAAEKLPSAFTWSDRKSTRLNSS